MLILKTKQSIVFISQKKGSMKMIKLDNFHQLEVLNNWSLPWNFPSLLMWFGDFFLLLFPELTGWIDQTCMCVFLISLKKKKIITWFWASDLVCQVSTRRAFLWPSYQSLKIGLYNRNADTTVTVVLHLYQEKKIGLDNVPFRNERHCKWLHSSINLS